MRRKRVIKRRPQAAVAIRVALERLEADAFDPRLRTHKLKGDLADCWSCSVERDLRIVFQFIDLERKQSILLMSLGTHGEVY